MSIRWFHSSSCFLFRSSLPSSGTFQAVPSVYRLMMDTLSVLSAKTDFFCFTCIHALYYSWHSSTEFLFSKLNGTSTRDAGSPAPPSLSSPSSPLGQSSTTSPQFSTTIPPSQSPSSRSPEFSCPPSSSRRCTPSQDRASSRATSSRDHILIRRSSPHFRTMPRTLEASQAMEVVCMITSTPSTEIITLTTITYRHPCNRLQLRPRTHPLQPPEVHPST